MFFDLLTFLNEINEKVFLCDLFTLGGHYLIAQQGLVFILLEIIVDQI